MKSTLTQLSHGLGIETAPQPKETMKTALRDPSVFVAFYSHPSALNAVKLARADAIATHNGHDHYTDWLGEAERLLIQSNTYPDLVEALQFVHSQIVDRPGLEIVRGVVTDELRKAGIEL